MKVRNKTIAIDASRAFLAQPTGIERYSLELIKHLREPLVYQQVVLYVRPWSDAKNFSDRSAREHIERNFFPLPETWVVKAVKRRRLWTQLGLAEAMYRSRPEILLVPAHTIPFVHPRNTVVVVHGLEYKTAPSCYGFRERLYMDWSIKFSCRHARHIVAVSESTKRDIVKFYRIPERKISVIYEGVNRPENITEPSADCPRLTEKYFLFVGRLESRKGIVGLIESFARFKEKTGLPYKLVLAGRPGYGFERIKKVLETSFFASDIILPGFVDENCKWALLRRAETFLFVTEYEGFGLPVLEAQSVGVPVIVSDNSSLPEVVGQSALKVPFGDRRALAQAMFDLTLNDKLRCDIIGRGLKNVRRFSWEEAARQVAAILLDKKQS